MFDVTFELSGAEEVNRRLAKVTDPKAVRRLARTAARRGMVIVRNAARDRAKTIDDPASPANIAKNIVVQESARAGRAEGGIVMRVGIRGGANPRSPALKVAGLPGGDTRHWRYLEFGTEDTPAQPFMRQALEANAERVAQKITAELSAGLDKLGV